MIVRFPDPATLAAVDPAAVGGKAAALIRLGAAGLPVPPGVALPAAFFSSWIETLRASAVWTKLAGSPPHEWGGLVEELKRLVPDLPWSVGQREALAAVRRALAPPGGAPTVAVRSSSPEEDLASASFAGLYDTRLAVPLNDLEGAVRACFASCLDARVLNYKLEHGLDPWSPRLAVIVQQQLDAEVAGVAFSIDPATNDYDQAAIDASWGLGSTVVDGRVTPDHFVVDKRDGSVIEETRGDKRVSRAPDPAGGTRERPEPRAADRTLSDARIRELAQMVVRVEELEGVPVDVEWAWAGGRLHLLQARPITSWVPLPPEMLTRPGERRLLYADAALSKGLTSNEPISPLGLDTMECLLSAVLESRLGPLKPGWEPREAPFFFAGGRMYANLSQLLWLQSPQAMARQNAPTDALMASILSGVDRKRYRSARRPSWLGVALVWRVPRVLWRLRRFAGNALRLLVWPETTRAAFLRRIAAFEKELREDDADDGLPLPVFLHTRPARMARELFDVMLPMLFAGMLPPGPVAGRAEDSRELAARLQQGVPGNVVVEMGTALFHLSRLLDPSDFEDLPGLIRRLVERRLPEAFLEAWDGFVGRFGWRGPLEMDVARPRYADDPSLALRAMASMAGEGSVDPEALHRRQASQREAAREELMRRAGPLRRALLRRVDRLITLFAGFRDTPKHMTVLFVDRVRRRALAAGRRLTERGRLDAAGQVFDLRLDDLRAAEEDPALDLRALRAERTRFHERLATAVRWFPPVIDSRGRILRPAPAADASGRLRGMAVSPGVVMGPVRVLRTPYEKEVRPGDVLVAYTTDPGWTPLFVNAAAIVLEVGGVLQHGAVVAREYGKPCVVGIAGVVERLQDAARVEVDGTAGTVRPVEAGES